jgi:hypothetical protein
MELTVMVANHLASLPRPPLLHAQAPPQATYDRQKVLSTPGIPQRHRHDHPHGQVIDPPIVPEVVILEDDNM